MSTWILKHLTPVFQLIYRKYVSRTRQYRYKLIRIQVYPGVFYPGFIFSTKIFLKFIDELDLNGKTFLELGAGSGIISLLAAQKGASVTATDINPISVKNIQDNARMNSLKLTILQSDLFNNLKQSGFDFVIINPPYYPRDPLNFAEMAWYCGKNFEYFENLFTQLQSHYNEPSTILMILSEDTDIEAIRDIAANKRFEFFLVYKKKKLGEWNFIFQIRKRNGTKETGGG